MHERFLLKHAGIVNQKFRREIIRTVDDKIVILVADNVADIGRSHELVVGVDIHVRIHRIYSFLARLNFRFADIRRLVNNLPLQIREVNDVKINKADGADAGRRKVHGCGSTEPPRANDEHLAIEQFFLPFAADLL